MLLHRINSLFLIILKIASKKRQSAFNLLFYKISSLTFLECFFTVEWSQQLLSLMFKMEPHILIACFPFLDFFCYLGTQKNHELYSKFSNKQKFSVYASDFRLHYSSVCRLFFDVLYILVFIFLLM